MTQQSESASLTNWVRLAGLCYLFIIIGGLFSEAYVRGSIIVAGDAGDTARAIIENEDFWRMGATVNLLYLALNIPVGAFFYLLFRRAAPALSLMMLMFIGLCATVEAVNLLNMTGSFGLLGNPDALGGLNAEQREALAYSGLRQFSMGMSVALVFFGFFCVILGKLIWQMPVLPRAIGALMMLAGFCYLINSVVNISGLDLPVSPWILLPCLVAELSVALWLLVRGVRTEQG